MNFLSTGVGCNIYSPAHGLAKAALQSTTQKKATTNSRQRKVSIDAALVVGFIVCYKSRERSIELGAPCMAERSLHTHVTHNTITNQEY